MEKGCNDFRDRIERYLDGELSSHHRADVERHVQRCVSCRQTFILLQLQGDLLRQQIKEAADQVDFSGFEDRVLLRIEKESRLPWWQQYGLWLREVLIRYRAVWISSLATAALLLAVLVPILSGDRHPQDKPAQPTMAGTADNEVIIDSMEYLGERSMIFTVSKNNTTVIWLYDMKQLGEKKTQGDEL